MGKKFRVPAFLSTTTDKSVAADFAHQADPTGEYCAIWRVLFDPKGEHDPEFRVKNIAFVSETPFADGLEVLFEPYSVFTLVSISWDFGSDEPHEFTLDAALDNNNEDESLPVAPWY